MEDKQTMTMEEAFDRLNQVLNEMESGEYTLEETFTLYEEGLKLVRHCHETVDTMEKKLMILEGQDPEAGEE